MRTLRDEDGMSWYFGLPFKSKRAAAGEPWLIRAGDVVRVVSEGSADGGSLHGAKVGETHVVKDLRDNGMYAESGWYFRFHEVEFVSRDSNRKLRVGDRVRLRDDNRGYGNVGDTGSIISMSGNTALIKFDTFSVLGDSKWCAPFDRIQLLPTFTPDTRVRLKRCVHRFAAGDTGTVTVQSEDSVGVRMDEGRYWSFAPDVLEVVQGGAPDCSTSNGEEWISREGLVWPADATKPKFKAGDRVRTSAVNDAGIGVVLGPNEFDHNYYKVKFDTWYGTCSESASCLTLVTPAPANDPATPCIVMRLDDGEPRPSYCPHVHSTAVSATTEAERLASINPGKQFDVYQRVTGRVADVRVNTLEVS